MTNPARGLVFNIQKFSTHDGPGIRTVVFLKGCSLACAWCENPESQIAKLELFHVLSRCIGCESCLEPELEGLISRTAAGTLAVDRSRPPPEAARSVCPAGALEVKGALMDADEVIAEVAKDSSFFETSGGGLTISGGEPLLQAEFTQAIAEAALERGISVAIETCLAAPRSALERLAGLPILWLADLKHTDATTFAAATGGNLPIIEANFEFLADAAARSGSAIIFRIPVIPGFNDDEASMRALLARARALAAVHHTEEKPRVHLLPYHDLARSKYAALGRGYPLPRLERPSLARMERYASMAREIGLEAQIGG